jgi:hypothetical protein
VSLANCNFYSELKGRAIYASTSFLGLSQLNAPAGSGNLLGLVSLTPVMRVSH